MSTKSASTRPTGRTEDVNKSKDKALVYIEEIMQGIHTVEENTREAKEIKYSDRRSVTFVTNQAAS
jgi:hypothetical protein